MIPFSYTSVSSEAHEVVTARRLADLRRQYRSGTSSWVIVAAVRDIVENTPLRRARVSLSCARMLNFAAAVLIDTGASEAISLARTYIETARGMVRARFAVHGDSDTLAYNALISVVQSKASGDLSGALSQNLAGLFELNNLGAKYEDKIALNRQLVMLRQDPNQYIELASEAIKYKDLPLEFFGTIKRLFEWQLKTGNVRAIEQSWSLLRQAAQPATSLFSPLSKVSFLKNYGQYLLALGRHGDAASALARAKAIATRLGFSGQVRQIDTIIRTGELPTFLAE